MHFSIVRWYYRFSRSLRSLRMTVKRSSFNMTIRMLVLNWNDNSLVYLSF
ncbi:MAG: hypothetical protein UD961_02395 [Bacteroidales bacterium]|nr:hypothetical protein [Bacteroidales bacterium]